MPQRRWTPSRGAWKRPQLHVFQQPRGRGPTWTYVRNLPIGPFGTRSCKSCAWQHSVGKTFSCTSEIVNVLPPPEGSRENDDDGCVFRGSTQGVEVSCGSAHTATQLRACACLWRQLHAWQHHAARRLMRICASYRIADSSKERKTVDSVVCPPGSIQRARSRVYLGTARTVQGPWRTATNECLTGPGSGVHPNTQN